ncbi:MAG: Type II secretion system protein G [Microgenomates group bacterium GW2011_GWF2_45_18]|nr:MAG: Type II secretion system protein G [Microgenomates group bacterium GW2011_GWF1_44_10]KKU01768.1 MAG: Type II secretion system protein G [Microgenomates group bacterium GW2011_GWF2_45_18]OGJ41483.1 MAG: hypothetical protein A2378_04385 [Candidatus Pacebacteria bacterium RIFOXYB1_FULL_44_10]HAU98928.1 hypothetical protein [Candidatus Paceibacterota bacterium]HAX01115.1 hypothetical protein [Candidatus Paceibacterota bacterium]
MANAGSTTPNIDFSLDRLLPDTHTSTMKHIKSFGFTLLELLVVISIIGILLSVSAVSYTNGQKTARDGKRKADMRAWQSALEQQKANAGNYPADCVPTTDYLPAGVPVDPKNQSEWIYYTNNCSTSTYCICAPLENLKGNSENTTCTFSSDAGSPYFCVKEQQ